jgi:hypothetical protein
MEAIMHALLIDKDAPAGRLVRLEIEGDMLKLTPLDPEAAVASPAVTFLRGEDDLYQIVTGQRRFAALLELFRTRPINVL